MPITTLESFVTKPNVTAECDSHTRVTLTGVNQLRQEFASSGYYMLDRQKLGTHKNHVLFFGASEFYLTHIETFETQYKCN